MLTGHEGYVHDLKCVLQQLDATCMSPTLHKHLNLKPWPFRPSLEFNKAQVLDMPAKIFRAPQDGTQKSWKILMTPSPWALNGSDVVRWSTELDVTPGISGSGGRPAKSALCKAIKGDPGIQTPSQCLLNKKLCQSQGWILHLCGLLLLRREPTKDLCKTSEAFQVYQQAFPQRAGRYINICSGCFQCGGKSQISL